MSLEHLPLINQQLKQARLGVQIEQRGTQLSLRGTFPPKEESQKLYPHQQRLRLSLPATPDGLRQATLVAKVVALQLGQNSFRWEHYVPQATDHPQASLLMTWLEAFEAHFWKTRGYGARSTWEKAYAPYFRKLVDLATLKPSQDYAQLIYQAILSTAEHSRSRQICCTAFKSLVEFVGVALPFEIKHLWGTYTSRSLQERLLPDDETIAAYFDHIPHPGWQFVYGVMATFGLRNHEVFFCDYEAFRTQQQNSIRVLSTTKTGSHEVWAFPPEWIDRFNLRQGSLPELNRNLTQTTLQRIGQRVSQQFRRYHVPFSPYDLRHAWAVRTIHYGLPDTIAAQMMGHSVAIHNRSYHRWLTRRDQERAVAAALQRSP